MKYYIIAGEASGDLHGSNLMKGLYEEDPNAEIRFWGGDKMLEVYESNSKNATGGLVKHYKDGAIIGFVEVLLKAKSLLGNVSSCKQDILGWNPDVVILIDYPGFNFKIAEFAHKKGFKVFYYIAPKVWASREGRIKKLKKYVDKLFIVFPFEIPYFKSKGIDFIYKGNPLVDAIDQSGAVMETRKDFLKRNSLEDRPIIAMLAGSRKGEIKTMMPVLTEFSRKLRSIPGYEDHQFLIAGAPARNMDDYSPWMDPSDDRVKVLFGQTQEIIRNARAAVVNSGTASLETVLLGTPQVVGYIGASRLTYLIAKKIVKVKYISLGNLIIDRLAFKEFIQDDCNSEAIVKEVRALIEDKEYREKMLSDYDEIRTALGGRGASRAVAKSMIKELEALKLR
ncbi:MAG: lipid-A-disaccharide synthase [Candidatus Cryptobacteroides sp.]